MDLIAYAMRRILGAIPVVFIIVTLTFFLVRLAPGGPFSREKQVAPEILEQIQAHYGLNDPVGVQYFNYLGNLLQGELGPSYKYSGWQVEELIYEKMWVSFELGFYALLFAIALGFPLGIVSASKPRSFIDLSLMLLALVGICLPSFVIGPLLQKWLALDVAWFPVIGWGQPGSIVLPSITLGLVYAAFIARLTRTSMIEERAKGYARVAQAKGASPMRVFGVHCLKNGVHPLLSYLGPAVSGLVSGSFVVETIFAIPGLGRFFVNSAFNRDYTMIMGTVIFYSILIIGFNLCSDVFQKAIHPVRREER